MIKGIDHVSVAVEDLDEALEMFKRVLGLEADHREVVERHGVEVATMRLGGSAIELVQGVTPESTVTKYVEKNGPGIHHIALETDDVDAEIARLQAENVELLDATARPGKEESRVAFIHPRSTGKILYELVQTAKR